MLDAVEPILDDADRDVWDTWIEAALLHSRTRVFRRRLDVALETISDALCRAPTWWVAWSGGKDSTVLAHLVHEIAPHVPLAGEKDDLDYPGEDEYCARLAALYGWDFTVLRPPFSVREWMAAHAHEMTAVDDHHSRGAELSKQAFYSVVEAHGAGYDGVFLGLRSRESRGRAVNRATHGVLYRKRPSNPRLTGEWVATPLADWTGLDVYAYAASRGIDLLPVYRCVGFLHRDDPSQVRKSWWLPNGTSARWGGVAWLRRYWPSLYNQLLAWMPVASTLT